MPVLLQPGGSGGTSLRSFAYNGKIMRLLSHTRLDVLPWETTMPMICSDQQNQIEDLFSVIREGKIAEGELNYYGKPSRKLHDLRLERLVVFVHAGDRVEARAYWSFDHESECEPSVEIDLTPARVLTWDDVYVEFPDANDPWLKDGIIRKMTIDTDLPAAEGELAMLPVPHMELDSKMFVVNVRIGKFDFPRPIRLNLQRVLA